MRFFAQCLSAAIDKSIELGSVMLPPFAERRHHRFEAPPQGCGRIVHARRDLAEHVTMNQAMFLQLAQLLDQNFLAHGGNQFLQFRQPLRTIEQVIQDDQLPAPRDDLQGAFGR
jgi:hypothetical protein